MEAVISQVDLTLINHTTGPNLPLVRVSLRDVFLLGVHRTECACVALSSPPGSLPARTSQPRAELLVVCGDLWAGCKAT